MEEALNRIAAAMERANELRAEEQKMIRKLSEFFMAGALLSGLMDVSQKKEEAGEESEAWAV